MKKLLKKGLFAVLSFGFAASLTGGVAVSGLIQPKAEEVTANYWTMTGVDDYTVEYSTVNGGGWTTTSVISEGVDTVTWSLNGGVKAPITWSNYQAWDKLNASLNALVITYKSTVDQDKSISIITTRWQNTYISLTDEISFNTSDQWKPYVTGTDQYIWGEYREFLARSLQFYFTTDYYLSVGNQYVMSKSMIDETVLAANTSNLPDGELKDKYTEGYISELFTVLQENYVTMDISFYGVSGESISWHMRSLSDKKYHDDNGTPENFACSPVLLPKHTALFDSASKAYNKWDLFDYKAPLDKSNYDLHGFYNIPAEKYQAGSKGWAVYGSYVGVSDNTFIPDLTVNEDVMLSVFTLQKKSGVASTYNNGAYCYYMPNVIREATDVITQKSEYLTYGETYKVNDLFDLTGITNTPANKIEVGGFLGDTWGTGSYFSMGVMDGSSAWSYTPAEGADTYTAILRPVDNIMYGYNSHNSPCEVGGMTFTWKIHNTNHTVTETVVEANCAHGGYVLHTCECGYSWKDSETPISGNHDHTGAWESDSSSHWKICSVCNTEIDKEMHSFDSKDALYCAVCDALAPQVNNEDTYWTITEGSADYSVKFSGNGIVTTVNNPSDIVELTFNSGVIANGWGNRLIMDFGLNTGTDFGSADAMVLTLTDQVNPKYQFTIVSTKSGYLYFALTDDISFDENFLPYITGTEQKLSGTYMVFLNSAVEYYITNDLVVSIRSAHQLADLKNSSVLSANSSKLPNGELKNRYTVNYIQNMLDSFAANHCELSLKFYNPSDTFKFKIRGINGQTLYAETEATFDGVHTQLPYVVSDYKALIASESKSYKLSDIFQSAFARDEWEVYGYYGMTQETTWSNCAKGLNGAIALNPEDYFSVQPNTEVLRFLLKARKTADGKTVESLPCYIEMKVVDSISDVFVQKDVQIKYGENYSISDLFEYNNVFGENGKHIRLGGYLGAEGTNGEYVDFGLFSKDKKVIQALVYDNYKLYIDLTNLKFQMLGEDASYYLAGKTFTFEVDNNKPEVSFVESSFVVGYAFDLRGFFNVRLYGGIESVEFTVNGTPISGYEFTPEEEGVYNVVCKVTDSRGFEGSLEVEISSVKLGLLENVTDRMEENVPYYFADPLLAGDGVYYTLALYKVDEDTPLTTETSYRFTESGEYILVYTIYGNAYVTPLEFVTEFEVIVVDELPKITVNGEFASTYYTGTTLVLPTATAKNSESNFDVVVGVTLDGQSVTVTENSIVLATAGVYKVSYSVTLPDERHAEKVFTFTCEADTEAPRLLIAGVYATNYEKGTEITILDALVLDNSGVNISATVKVTCNGEEVAVVENKFILKDSGTYTITYTAIDQSGNSIDQEFIFEVEEDEKPNEEKPLFGCNAFGGCGSSISGMGIFLVVTLMSVVFIGVRKRKE